MIGAPYHAANGAVFIYKTLTPEIAPIPDQIIREDSLFAIILPVKGYPPSEFSLLQAPEKMNLQYSSGLLEWTPENEDVGVNPVGVVVSYSLSCDTVAFQFTAVNVNDAPHSFSLLFPENNADLKISAGDSLAQINFSRCQAYDPDSGDVVNYTLLLSTDSIFTIPGMIDEIATNTDTMISLNRVDGVYFWKVKANDRDGADVLSPTSSDSLFQFKISRSTGVAGNKIISTQFRLAQKYPNPFNLATVIRFSLPIKSRVNLDIFNACGKKFQH